MAPLPEYVSPYCEAEQRVSKSLVPGDGQVWKGPRPGTAALMGAHLVKGLRCICYSADLWPERVRCRLSEDH